MRDEEFGIYDTRQDLEDTNSKSNKMIQDTFSVTELDPSSPINNIVQDTVTADSFTMDSLNTAATNDYPPSTNPQVQPVQQVPSKPQIRRLTPDTAEKVPQTNSDNQWNKVKTTQHNLTKNLINHRHWEAQKRKKTSKQNVNYLHITIERGADHDTQHHNSHNYTNKFPTSICHISTRLPQ